MKIRVFIECEAGTDQKNVFDEKTLKFKDSFKVSRKYPYPYGFIQGTKSGDGDCLDCFVLTNRLLKTQDIVEVEVIGLMEQFETRNGVTKEDHNILACFSDEVIEVMEEVKEKLAEFTSHVWDHRMGKRVKVGRFGGKEAATQLINNCRMAECSPDGFLRAQE